MKRDPYIGVPQCWGIVTRYEMLLDHNDQKLRSLLCSYIVVAILFNVLKINPFAILVEIIIVHV